MMVVAAVDDGVGDSGGDVVVDVGGDSCSCVVDRGPACGSAVEQCCGQQSRPDTGPPPPQLSRGLTLTVNTFQQRL